VLLFLVAKGLIKQDELYTAPEDKVPSLWVRGVLILTCTGVSFAHGSNDGQKGMGLMMLVLIAILPSLFSLNMDTSPQAIAQLVATSNAVIPILESQTSNYTHDRSFQQSRDQLIDFLKPQGQLNKDIWEALIVESQVITKSLVNSHSFLDLAASDRHELKNDIDLVTSTITKLAKQEKLANIPEQSLLIDYRKQLDQISKFIPYWVKITVALALGLGTMVGWKRVVVTVGEKIGEEHLNYAQGAAAELITMSTISAADYFGLPVSTTHILSSGIAGSMVANRSGLQMNTLKNLLLAWILTLPVCTILGFSTYVIALFLMQMPMKSAIFIN